MEYIILDLETTGLDLKHSSIIEVGAILVQDDVIKDLYSSFVKFDGELPLETKKRTGISEENVGNAPPPEVVIRELKSFIAKRPVAAHNGFGFDFPMLERYGLKLDDRLDSMEFAFFVLPTNTAGYSIAALSQQFGLGNPPHRALEDCQLTFEVVRKLQAEYTKKPAKQRGALKHLAKMTQWWWAELLPGKVMAANLTDLVAKYEPYRKEQPLQDILALAKEKIDPKEVEKCFVPSRSSSPDTDYSEDRPEQRKMALAVTQALNEQKHAVIEAGTGTGKSKAYLVPSILFALKNGIPAIVSTHTKTLQDQLFAKEIAHLKEIIKPDLRVTILKGKTNYVCIKKFDAFSTEVVSGLSQRSLYEFGESRVEFTARLAHLLLASWLVTTERGDWDELPYWLKERIPKKIEREICNSDELCGKNTCEHYENQRCFLAKARLRARDADLVIVNHAVVLSGIIVEEKQEEMISMEDIAGNEDKPQTQYSHTIFPREASFIVFDEAHHLEDDATSAWEHVISRGTFRIVTEQLFSPTGSGPLISVIAGKTGNERLLAQAESFIGSERDLNLEIGSVFKDILPHLVKENGAGEPSTYAMLAEISNSFPAKKQLIDSLHNLKSRLFGLVKILLLFSEEADNKRDRDRLAIRAQTLQRAIRSLDAISGTDKTFVRYLERNGAEIQIKAALLSVASRLKEYVYDNFASVILTSATITVNEKFNFFADRCGTKFVFKGKVNYYPFKSSFDYERQVKFLVPKGIIYRGNARQHFEKSVAFLEKAILASGGGALVLCSSHSQVADLYEKLERSLSKVNIWLLRQPRDSSVTSVIRDFKSDVNSVLIGTRKLWEGIDVPGDSLRALFIYKIPYPPMHDPLIKARKEDVGLNGGNGFSEYYEPLAALVLKQGFGRLIRKSTDRGIAVLLDEDLLKKDRILKSLPEGVHPQAADAEHIYKALHDLLVEEIQ